MHKLALTLTPILFLLTPACAVDMDTHKMWTDLDRPSLGLAEGRAEFRGPVRLGIAPPLRTGTTWRGKSAVNFDAWTEAERAVIDRWAQRYVDGGAVTEVSYLPNLLVDRQDGERLFPSLRDAARRADVDAVLVINSMTDERHMPNALAILDLSIVGMFIFPAHHGKAVTVAEAVVFDVESAKVYAFAAKSGEATTTSALAYYEKEKLEDDSRVESLDALGSELCDAIQRRRAGG